MFDPFGLYAWMDLDADTRASVNGVLLTMLCIGSLWCGKVAAKRTVKLAGLVLACFRAWRTAELTDFDQAVLEALADPAATVDATGCLLKCKCVVVRLKDAQGYGKFDVLLPGPVDTSCLDELSPAGHASVEKAARDRRDLLAHVERSLKRMDRMEQLASGPRKPEGKGPVICPPGSRVEKL
jgi:hypothetical protein